MCTFLHDTLALVEESLPDLPHLLGSARCKYSRAFKSYATASLTLDTRISDKLREMHMTDSDRREVSNVQLYIKSPSDVLRPL